VNSTPIENVTIKLSEVRSDTTEVFLKGTVSDTLGKFSFKNLKASKYLLEFSHVNYDYYATEVTLKKDQAKTVTSIVLTENLYTLNEIILSGKKLPITQTADKITVNVSSNVLAAGGTPIDILKQLPIISISSEGNISIRGKRDIQILINGKPSGFAALQGQRFLDQLDLSTIEKIEVITNPSVVQSSNGAGGVINIIMKRNTKNGFNGSLNSGVGNDEWYHFSPGISYRFGKVNLFINYTLRNRKRISANVNLKQQEVANDLQLITEEQHGIRDDTRHNAEFGIDYYINENKYITFAGNYRSRNKKDTQKRTSVLSNVNDVIESRLGTVNEPETNEGWGIITQFTSSKNNNNNSTVLLDYVHSIEDETIFREELVSSSIPDFTNGIQSFYIDTNDRVLLDFEKKRQLKDSSNITYGAQAIYRKINQTFNALELNNSNGLYENIPALNDTFNYEDFISAVYFQTEKNTLKWSYQAAIRFELLNNNYTSASIDKVFKQHYFKFFPSLKLSYGFTDKTTAVFSLKKGLNRPSPNRLNPFPDISNAFNVSSGNPELLPEIFYTIETSLKTKVHKVSLTTGLFFTAYNDVIQQVTELRDDGITVRFPKNINTMYHYGIDLSLQVSPTKWWSQQIGGLFYNRTYKDDFIEASEKITYQIKSTSTVSISNSIGLQLFGNYTAPENTTQGEMGALYFFDVGLDYEFLNKKGKLSLIATDIFNSLKETSLLLNDGLSLHSNQKINSRRIYLSLSYKF
jgi:outer membrane receptor protein involved in Fe transport